LIACLRTFFKAFFSSMFEKNIVIDCRGHLLGRLASIMAKELLSGQRIICVRTEEINISGTFARNKVKYLAFLRKRCNINPQHGPLHFRSPTKILWRCVRGMLPHKTPRGAAALKRLKLFEGVPPPFDRHKRVVVPEALRVLRMAPGRPFCLLKRLAVEFGWKHSEVVHKLEEKRKVRSAAWFARRKALKNVRKQAIKNITPKLRKKGVAEALRSGGYSAYK